MAFGSIVLVTGAFIILWTRTNIWITVVLLALYHSASLTGRQASGIKRDNEIVAEEV
jgi:hypothetical protein